MTSSSALLTGHRKPRSPVSPLLGRKYGPFQPPARQIELKVKLVDCLHKEVTNKRPQTTYTYLCQFPETAFPHPSRLKLNRHFSCQCISRNRLQVVCSWAG